VATPAAATSTPSASPTPTALALAPVGAIGPGGAGLSGPGLSLLGPQMLGPFIAIGGLFFILVARRRRRRPMDAALGTLAGSGVVASDGSPVLADMAAAAAVAAVHAPGVAPLRGPDRRDPVIEDDLEPIDEDAPLKRTRKVSPKRAAGAAVAAAAATVRTFDGPAATGVSRAKVGYRQVRISSEPDAVRSTELGRLDRGDEVEILESHEGFLRVRTPDEITGWILRHTIVGGSTA